MDSGLVISSHEACSATTVVGGNLWFSRHSPKNIYNANSCATRGLQHKGKSQIEHNVLRFQNSILNQHHKFIEERSTHQRYNKKYIVKVSKPSFDLEPHSSDSKNILDSVKDFLAALYNFAYPYSMISLGLNIISSSFIAVEKLSDISPLFFFGLLQAVIPQLFILMYVNGVNQLFDYEIDKMNKPYLPLASGQLSYKSVVIITLSCLTMGIWLSWIIGSSALIWRLVSIVSLWTAYSINLPLLRWKRHPLLAIMVMVLSSAFILPITSFLHMQTFVLKRATVLPRSLTFVVGFMSLYSAGMMLTKDIPDIEGDKAYGINTFSVRLGGKRVLWFCVFIFEMAFGVAILGATTSSHLWSKIVMGLGHFVLASILWYRAKYVDLKRKSSIMSFYVLTWKVILYFP
ncbi:hypothetical protein Fmac_003974 [Flemingia macrophylla]|uniref:Glycinol 4-dimethylallyltransferase n=1 Tax=Flemingia macrophylla TaxID=520843 RepID=A0ABD1N3R5_9FABA